MGKVTPWKDAFNFWKWFLTSAIFNMVDVENMDSQDMEASFKFNTLILGRSAFFRADDEKLYCLPFADAGDVPIYPGTIIKGLITNSVLGEYTVIDGFNGVFVYLSQLDRIGLACGYDSLINTIASELADNSVTVRQVQFIKRLPTIFVGKTSPDITGMKALLESVKDGETALLTQSKLGDSIQRLDGAEGAKTPLSEFTEYQQYKIGQFYNTIGVNSVWNLKREKVSASEQTVSDETARYNIKDIISNLNKQLENVNAMFGTDYRVKLNVDTVSRETPENTETETELEVMEDGDKTD